MNLTTALKVADDIEKYTGAEGQDFPTDKAVLEALFVFRDTLLANVHITHEANGTVRVAGAIAEAPKPAGKLSVEQEGIAARQRSLPTDVQMAVNSQLRDCGHFLKPVLKDRPSDDIQNVFNGLLEALVSVAEVGVTGRRDPRIVLTH